jgi:hypothetical protein
MFCRRDGIYRIYLGPKHTENLNDVTIALQIQHILLTLRNWHVLKNVYLLTSDHAQNTTQKVNDNNKWAKSRDSLIHGTLAKSGNIHI